MKGDQIVLELKAKHFKDTSYWYGEEGCAIEKAVKDIGIDNGNEVNELVGHLVIGTTYYIHDYYGAAEFDNNKELASKFWNKAPDRVIKTLILTEL